MRIGPPAQHQAFRVARALLAQKSHFFESVLGSLPRDKGALESVAVSGVDPDLFGVVLGWETDNRIHPIGQVCQVLVLATSFQMGSTMDTVLEQVLSRQEEFASNALAFKNLVNFAYGSSDRASTSLLRKIFVRNFVAVRRHGWDYLLSDFPDQFVLDVVRDLREHLDSLPEEYRPNLYTADDL